jgi:uncharacterized protein YkwD
MQYFPLPKPRRALLLLAAGLTIAAISSAAAPESAQATHRHRRPKPAKTVVQPLVKPVVQPAVQPIVQPAVPAIAANNSDQSFERAVHDQVNQYRASQNLPPFAWNDAIATQARQHSANMANGQTAFGHDGFAARVKATGISFQGAAENVAYNQGYSDPVAEAVKGWIASPGHQKNMVGDYSRTGIGVTRNAQGEIYFTQLFIR